MSQKLVKTVFDSPVGRLLLVVDDSAVIWLGWINEGLGSPKDFDDVSSGENAISKETLRQLSDYFSGKRKQFNLPLLPKGSTFQKKVWEELYNIPYGQVITYGEQANRLGMPKASRAVGAANGKNPICIIVPCHRVIGRSGKLTGFGGGLQNKMKLLQLEGALR